MLVIVKEISEESFHLIGTKGFHIEAKNEIFSVVSRFVFRTRNLKIFCRRLADYVIKLHARAARLVFVNQPMMLLICDIFAAVADAFS